MQFTCRTQLALSDHVHEFDTGKRRRSRPKGFEPEHWAHNSFDGTVILFDKVIIWHV
jgi:hypothetical protein